MSFAHSPLVQYTVFRLLTLWAEQGGEQDHTCPSGCNVCVQVFMEHVSNLPPFLTPSLSLPLLALFLSLSLPPSEFVSLSLLFSCFSYPLSLRLVRVYVCTLYVT